MTAFHAHPYFDDRNGPLLLGDGPFATHAKTDGPGAATPRPATPAPTSGGGSNPRPEPSSNPAPTPPGSAGEGAKGNKAPTGSGSGAADDARAGVNTHTGGKGKKGGSTTPTYSSPDQVVASSKPDKGGKGRPGKSDKPSNSTPPPSTGDFKAVEYAAEGKAARKERLEARPVGDSKRLDAETPPATKRQLKQDQAELEQQEARIRKQYPPNEPQSNGPAVADRYRSDMRQDGIQAAREEYFADHDRYVDEDGTVYAAKLDDESGDIVLQRTEQAREDEEYERSIRIATDRSRIDTARTTATVEDEQGDVEQVHTETVRTNAKGATTGSSISDEQRQERADGSVVEARTSERYAGDGTLRVRSTGQTTTQANGDVHAQDTNVTFQRNGKTPATQTVTTTDSTGGQTATSEALTRFAGDGVTPRRTTLTEGGTDADGEALPSTVTDTMYSRSGLPQRSYITRGGELEEGTPPTELVYWGRNGEVRRSITGQEGTTRGQLEQFADYTASHTGTPPGSSVSGIAERDPDAFHGSRQQTTWTRGSDNEFTPETTDVSLVDPLEPSEKVPSVFDVPAQLQQAGAARRLDHSQYATDPAAMQQLQDEQAAYEQDLAGTKGAAAREALMRDYFSSHDYWVDESGKGDPALMAAAWSDGQPDSELFGGKRMANPHAVAARLGDEAADGSRVDSVTRMYVDGSRDELERVTSERKGGERSVAVTGEYVNSRDIVEDRVRRVTSTVPRFQQGLEPLQVEETSKEHFDAKSGKPVGEQYSAVTRNDSQTTALEERRDLYGADGKLDDTKIESTDMSRNFDAEATARFVGDNAAMLELADEDDLHINDDGTSIVAPPSGSYRNHSTTDIDYDAKGRPIHQLVSEDSLTVEASGDDNGNGTLVRKVDTSREMGEVDGTKPIFDRHGRPLVDEVAKTTIETQEFDPDAGQAGGDQSVDHQYRSSTKQTLGSTTHPDGTTSDEWSTPMESRTLQEGSDDDWKFVKSQYATDPDGTIVTDDDDNPVSVGAMRFIDPDREFHDENGDIVSADHFDTTETGDTDAMDKFESFMEGVGGKILLYGGAAAGILAAPLSGGASLALTGVAIAAAGAQTAKAYIDYRQGEGSLGNVALSAAGGLTFGVGGTLHGLQTLRAARAAGAVGTKTALYAGRADIAVSGIEGVQAGKMALDGDWSGAAMFGVAGAAGLGTGVYRWRKGRSARAEGSVDVALPDAPGPGRSGDAGDPRVLRHEDGSLDLVGPDGELRPTSPLDLLGENIKGFGRTDDLRVTDLDATPRQLVADNVDRLLGSETVATSFGPGRVVDTAPGVRGRTYEIELDNGKHVTLSAPRLAEDNLDTLLERAGVGGVQDAGDGYFHLSKSDIAENRSFDAKDVEIHSIQDWLVRQSGKLDDFDLDEVRIDHGAYARHNGVEVWLETAGAELRASDIKKLNQIRMHIDSLKGVAHADRLRSVELLNSRNPTDAYFRQRYATGLSKWFPFLRRDFRAAATGGNGSMTFWNGNFPTRSTFDHEFGHVSTDTYGPADLPRWIEAAGIDDAAKQRKFWQWLAGKKPDAGVSEYATSAIKGEARSYNEDWADSFKLYRADESGFRARFPKRAELLDEYFSLPNTSRPTSPSDLGGVHVRPAQGGPRPRVSSAKLLNRIEELYRHAGRNGMDGNGTTMDAAMTELHLGGRPHGKDHVAKAESELTALNRWITSQEKRYTRAPGDPRPAEVLSAQEHYDLVVARSLASELREVLAMPRRHG